MYIIICNQFLQRISCTVGINSWSWWNWSSSVVYYYIYYYTDNNINSET